MSRIVLKITGAQGQGVNSVGEICAKGLKRAGYCVLGYREYASVIKGGHSSYQLDISPELVRGSETKAHVLVCFNHHGLTKNLREVQDGGIVLHQTPEWKFSPEDQQWVEEHNVRVIYLPSEKILKTFNLKPIFGNVLITSVVWSFLGQDADSLKELIREQFGRKGEEVVQKNFECIDAGIAFMQEHAADAHIQLPKPEKKWRDHMLLTGSQAMGIGIIHAGCRVFTGYPMTPSSPLLSYIAEKQNMSGMVVKQAEDEITAIQMVVGAMHMGTRAMTTTSGGGYDLMTETISLSGMSETPAVVVLAQRPGPATGLPTWTAQGDLLLAVHSSHGEFPRLVLSVSDGEDSFTLLPEAFNYAEEYQIPVIVLTDKQIAECLYTQKPYDQQATEVRRGKLVTDAEELTSLTGADRYDPMAEGGVSRRWLPGANAATYCAQSYEHTTDGSFEEGAEGTKQQMGKRMRKMETLKKVLPEPELFTVHRGQISEVRNAVHPEVLFVGWGSTKGAVLDALLELTSDNSSLIAGYLHYTYLWPLKTGKLEDLAGKTKKVILIEGNQQGQLGMLIRQECGLDIPNKILKFDGRPFFIDELRDLLSLHTTNET
ncbi:MAG: 2-oxoacid:acceptor oxidoreductase subunit alpha [Candidatus Peribacteraceae bacterium]|nr:2-oxoacid:acceptor oxidoreductase subunit alpha [Candidatus Peribacteraceae bacterium]